MIDIDKVEEKAMSEFPDPIGPGGRYDDGRLLREARNGYIKGYRQAEKDNDLTWEDIQMIFNASRKVFWIETNVTFLNKTDKEKYEEVLREFKREKDGN